MYQYKATVIRVIDGDTVDLIVDQGFDCFRKMRIRLAGLNTPELRSGTKEDRVRGKAAREFTLSHLPVGGEVFLETIKDRTEKYGRYLARIFLDDTFSPQVSLNRLLINNGHATPYMEV